MKEQIQTLLTQSLEALVVNGVLTEVPDNIRIDHSKDKTQGDFCL